MIKSQNSEFNLILRDMDEKDLEAFWYWLQPGNKWKEFDGPYYKESENQIFEYFQNKKKQVLAKNFKFPRTWLAIVDKDSDELIGLVNSYWRSKETNWLCAGIIIFNDKNWGKGMGTKALTLWVTYLFKNRPEICRLGLETWSGNNGLIFLAQKLGFQEEARYRKARIFEGAYYDSVAFGILREEWKQNLIAPGLDQK